MMEDENETHTVVMRWSKSGHVRNNFSTSDKEMWQHLQRGSSPIDWCETNYAISPNIAEFVNTVSNILFLLLPPLLIYLSKEYAKFVNPAINFLWVLLMVIGMSSAYFHATLSLVGQLLDEIAILWVVIAAFTAFLPKRLFPKFVHGSRTTLSYYAGALSVVSTCCLVMRPEANAFVLLSLAAPAFYFMKSELKRAKCMRVYRLGLRTAAVWLLAIFCWIMDKIFCDAWISIDFPYLHALWHILIFIGGYTSLVLLAYFHVYDEGPEQKPRIKYWPVDSFELGIAYVIVKYPKRKRNQQEI